MGLSLRRSKSPCIMMYLLLRCTVLLTVTLLVQAAPRWHTNHMTIINGQTYINGKPMGEVKPCPECAECAAVSCGGNSIIQRNGVLCCRPVNDHPSIHQMSHPQERNQHDDYPNYYNPNYDYYNPDPPTTTTTKKPKICACKYGYTKTFCGSLCN